MKQILTILFLLFTSLSGVVEQSPPTQQSQPLPVPQVLTEIGKPLAILREEHPNGVVFDRPDGYPDAAAICFGEVDGEIAYVFFGTQWEDLYPVMDAYSEELRCSGILTTAGALFPTMSDDMAFPEFFSLIGVSEYDYIAETDWDRITGAGWILFDYDSKSAAMDTNDTNQMICKDTQVIISNWEIEEENRKIAEASPLAPSYY